LLQLLMSNTRSFLTLRLPYLQKILGDAQVSEGDEKELPKLPELF
jgi:hypothetical protein